jgi:hypothetical protein
MRYHWGLGVGHFHVHQPAPTSGWVSHLTEDAEETQVPDLELQDALGESLTQANDRGSDMGYESERSELCLENLKILQGFTSCTFLKICWLRLDIYVTGCEKE